MFGNTSFGSPSFTTAPAFGGPVVPSGTTMRFVPFQGTDTVQKAGSGVGATSITTVHQNICAMKEYESKSVDELRLEDYVANRKVRQTPAGFGSSPFGQMQPQTSFTSSPFGATQQPSGSLFGANNNQPSTSLFGQPTQNQTGGLFGQNNTSNIFGANMNKPATTVASSPFTMGSPFGASTSTANNQSSFSSIFNKPAQPQTGMGTTSLFGANTSQPSTNLFGQPTQNQTTSVFGQPQTTNMFGSNMNKPATTVASSPFSINSPFGATTSTANNQSSFNNIFNKPAQPQTGLGTISSFGAPTSQPSTSLFGQSTQPQAGGLFGQTSSSNLFNSTMNKPATTVASSPFGISSPFGVTTSTANNQSSFSTLMNKPAQPQTSLGTTSLFGTATSQAATPAAAPAASLFGQTPAQNNPNTSLFGQANTSSLFNSTMNKPVTTVAGSPFGIGSPFATTTSTANNQTSFSSLFNKPAQPNTSLGTTSLFGTTANQTTLPTAQPTNSLFGQSPIQPQNTSLFGAANTSNLFNSFTASPMANNTNNSVSSVQTGLSLFSSPPQPNFSALAASQSPKTQSKAISQYKMNAKINLKLNKPPEVAKPANPVLFDGLDDNNQDELRCAIDVFVPKKSMKKLDIKPSFSDLSSDSPLRPNSPSDRNSFKSCLVSTRSDYKLRPSLEEIERRYDSETDTCIIDSLFIERTNYGSILWEAQIDVKGMNLDDIVHIRRKEVIVYPDDENKPPVGHGLNRQATITLHQVWPIDKSSNQIIKDEERLRLMRYAEKIEVATVEKGARFIGYKPETGSWIFSVDHFSKYSLTDDELRHALFDDDRENEHRRSSYHGTKRLALQTSPNVSTTLIEQQPNNMILQRAREIKPVPDLFAARNKIVRDIASVCISGSSKVRFFNGSRRYCYSHGDKIIIDELRLVPTDRDGSLSMELQDRFNSFLEKNSTVVSYDVHIQAFAPYIETQDFIHDASSYELLRALYGDDLESKTPYAKQDERMNRVIRWLATTNQQIPSPDGLYQQILYHMSCDRYDLASQLALESNHPRLALLISTLNLNKDLIYEQLSSWRLSNADQYIDHELLKIYILLAGLTEWILSDDETIYCLKGLRWTQQMCLLANHVTGFVTEPEKYGLHLIPSYIKRLDTDTNDVDYHILARHSPANILSASTSLVEEWFLLESLKSFRVINSDSECVESDVVHCNLASQLTTIDLRWACFVAAHIINNDIRRQVLIRCLEQNQNQLRTSEQWFRDTLKVPSEIIETARSKSD